MDFLANFNSTSLLELGQHNPFYVLWFIIKNGGWIFIAWVIFSGLKDVWLNWRQTKYAASIKWTYLAIDVPKDNEQSPKAVEQIFNQMWGALKGANFIEKWWQGYFQPAFSLEIVSIEGYIQYIIRTPKIFRDLVEAAFYAQYPDANIIEIEDYTSEFTPDNFKEKGYELWGTQFELTNKEYYPIKTYPLFEHGITQKIIDPLSALLEMMSKLGKGEQLWYQIAIKPVPDDSWKRDAQDLVKQLIGVEIKKKKSSIDVFLEKIFTMFNFMFPTYQPEKKSENSLPSNVLYMSKGELDTVTAIEIKATKTGYKTKMRMIYLAKKDVFFKPRGVSPFVGALKQYSAINLNGFKPAGKTTTKADYYRVKQRVYKKQRKILAAYKSRSIFAGVNPDGYLLNVEELASLYHFPSKEVGTTAVKTIESKKAPPPLGIPKEMFEEIAEPSKKQTISLQSSKGESQQVAPPPNLPT